MENKFVDEKNFKNKMDLKLLKRLLKYSKPYAHLLALSLLLILVVTSVDLARPYMTKILIDDFVDAYSNPMMLTDFPLDDSSIEFKNKYYTRIAAIPSTYICQEDNTFQLLKKSGEYILIKGGIPDNSSFEISNSKVLYNGDSYSGTMLTKEEYLVFRAADIKGIFNITLLLIILLFIGLLADFLQTFLLSYSGLKIVHLIRTQLYNHVNRLSLGFFNKTPTGMLLTRITNDMENLNELYSSVIVSFLKDMFLFFGTGFMMLKLDIKLSGIIFLAIPLVGLLSYLYQKKSRDAYREVRRRLSAINSSLGENFSGIKIIQGFAQEKAKIEEFDRINTAHKEASMVELKVFAIFRPIINFTYSLTLALLLYYGGGSVISSAIEFGVLFAFISYLDQFFQPIFDISEKLNILQSAMASAERAFELLDNQEFTEEILNPIEKEFKGKIEFKNVWFAYKDENYVLKDVSFTIEPGETVAFVGATGSGKTTIISLISRLYDIQKGEILIDDVNIKEMSIPNLRKQIASVLQDVFLFTGDILENIRLQDKAISEEKAIEASKYVNAHRFISKMPKGYRSKVEENGATLSSGERQLLSFARALVTDPKILILDEATSSIDTGTEELIQDAIQKLVENRTTIVVAHRLSTIQHSDKIVVMHKGAIQEMGSHLELLKNKGLYYNLYLLQYES